MSADPMLPGWAPTSVRTDRLALAQSIRRERYAVASAILAGSVRRSEMNVGLELTALSFAERFADAIASGDTAELLGWVDAVCARYAAMPVIARLFSAATSTIAGVVGAHHLGLDNRSSEFAVLAGAIEQIAHRPRASGTPIAPDTLDEIDVLLGELVGRLEAADPLTAEHSRAVAVWCMRIARQMTLSRAETTYISRCGLIHDIGKIATPLAILSAPRRLTDAEMATMREHASAGATMITAIPMLAHHTPAVRGHHERLDGRGYPDGLRASQIPLSARVVAVADSFNAMIGNRPYRLPMRPTAALAELRVHAGKQFDPEVIEAMNDVLTRRT